MTTTNNITTEYHLRSEEDLIALVLHQYGYWPQDSLVLLSVTEHAVGPCLRVDLPTDEQDLADYFGSLVDLIPATFDGCDPIIGVFALIFSGDSDLRERQLDSATRREPQELELYMDQRAAGHCNHWLAALGTACDAVSLGLYDVLYVGAVSRWSLDQERLALCYRGPVEDITHSSYYLERLYEGSSVASNPALSYTQSAWDTAPSSDEQDTVEWEQTGLLWMQTFQDELKRATDHRPILEHPGYHAQKSVELCYWESALNAVRWAMRVYPSCGVEENEGTLSFGDRLRAIIPAEIAGYLLGTLNTQGTLEYVLYQAASGFPAILGVLDEYESLYAGASSTYMPVEPLCYGKPTTHRRHTLPETFHQTLQQQSSYIGDTAHKRVSWHDWVKRTHRMVQQYFEEMRSSHEVSEPHQQHPQMNLMTEMISGLTLTAKPMWNRLNALEVLCNLLANIVRSGEQYGRIRLMQSWINWLRGGYTYAQVLADIAQVHCDDQVPFFHALSESLLPLWIADPLRCWRGEMQFSTVRREEIIRFS